MIDIYQNEINVGDIVRAAVTCNGVPHLVSATVMDLRNDHCSCEVIHSVEAENYEFVAGRTQVEVIKSSGWVFAPEGATHRAKDKDGRVHYFKGEPELYEAAGQWVKPDWGRGILCDKTIIHEDWKESLQTKKD